MSIIISESIVLGAGEEDYTNNNPRIGWHNILTIANVSSDEEDSDYPLVNIVSPVTYQLWKGETTGQQAIQVSLSGAETVNYWAIAGHNLGSAAITVKLQSSDDGENWDDVTTERLLGTDFAFLEEFADETAVYFRLLLTPGSAPPEIAVLHVGRILRCQRRLYVGHRPMTLNRKTEVSSGRSESGQFLGRVVRSRTLEGSADFKNLTPEWYRTVFEEFVTAAESRPFFWAWRPGDYPKEIAYAWLSADPEPSNQLSNGMMSVALRMQGVR